MAKNIPQNPLFASAETLAALLKQKQLSSSELLKMTLTRIEEDNPGLNAVVAFDIERARRETDEADKRLLAGEGRSLEGLVITIKDSIDVTGMPSTSGAPVHKERLPERDASVVSRLRQAGAIIVGKTNVPIFTGDFQSFNSVYGVTNNPWNPTRSPGGSSGGAAAAVATGMSAFELGSDFAGSIRWPAHACGIFGHRPSFGLVSSRGHVPPAPGATFESDFSVIGPLTRSSEDLALILDIIHGPAALDGIRPQLPRSIVDDPKELRVAVWADDADAPVDSSVSEAVRKAAAILAGLGAEVDETARPAFSFAEEMETFGLFNHAIIASGFPPEVRERLARRAKDFSPDDRSHRALQARGAQLDVESWRNLQLRRAAFEKAWQSFFDTYDVLLCPPAPVAAIPHDHRPNFHERTLSVNGIERPYFDFLSWSSLSSLSGLPASVAPVGVTADGLPLGVQIISGAGRDLTSIAVAGMLEKFGRGFIPPELA